MAAFFDLLSPPWPGKESVCWSIPLWSLPFLPDCSYVLLYSASVGSIALVALVAAVRIINRVQAQRHLRALVKSPPTSPRDPLSFRGYGDDAVLHDRRLRHRYRKLKQNWLQQGKMLFRKFRFSKGRLERVREDGLSSMYAKVPTVPQVSFHRERRHSIPHPYSTGIKLSDDGQLAFNSIMDQWKVWGGKDVPLLMEVCQGAICIDMEPGTLFEEGQLIQNCLNILKEGEVEFVASSSGTFETVSECGTILSGLVDLVSILCNEPTTHCVTARCTKRSKIIQVPILTDNWPTTATKTGAQSRCRLIRSSVVRAHRVTVLTAYSYLGVVLDAYPKAPVTPIPPEVQAITAADEPLTEDQQIALKALVRSVLALDDPFVVQDVERYMAAPMSPKPTGRSFGPLKEVLASASTESATTPRSPSPSLIKLLKLKEGDSLQDVEQSHSSLHVVLSGQLTVTRHNRKATGKWLFGESGASSTTHGPGAVIGYEVVLTGTSNEWCSQYKTRPVTKVSAATETWVLQICRPFIDMAVRLNSLDTITLAAKKVITSIPPFLRLVDQLCRFKQLDAGEVLVREGDASDGCLYLLLYGRCRSSVQESEGKVQVIADHGRGTLIGETELLTGGLHKATVQAVRYTSFAIIPSSVLRLLVKHHPHVLASLAERVLDKEVVHVHRADPSRRPAAFGVENAKTVLILPVTPSVPLDLFCPRLEAALLKSRRTVRVVTSMTAASVLGSEDDDDASFNDDELLLLESWLTQQEEQNEILLYRGDWHDSQWNRFVATMSDVVLLVANAADAPQISALEQKLDAQMRNAQKLLILLHVNPTTYYTPSGTRLWIEKRHGVNQHYHVRLHTHSPSYDQSHIRSDFARLARILTGTAIGLVLGGGGAKGMAHLGVLRVLEEEGIPVDMITGTSIGALIGGLYAQRGAFLEILGSVNHFAASMSSRWLLLWDITLPWTSWFNGYSFGRALSKIFGDAKIEDTWLTFACISVDLTDSRECVHRNGTLWRYVRASCTLANLLPPLCDRNPKDDVCHLLVDGGYSNILPADVCKEMGAETVIASNVAGEVRLVSREDYGDTLTGLQVLQSKAPTMSEISSQLMFFTSVASLKRAEEFIDFHLRPPVTHFQVLDWPLSKDIQNIGYVHAKEKVRIWKEAMKKGRGRRARVVKLPDRLPELDLKRGCSLNALDDLHPTE